MHDPLPSSEVVGGEGREQPIRFDEFRAYWPDELWQRGWVTRVWRLLIRRADQYGLKLVDDPDNHPKACGKAIERASFRSAPIRSWEVPGARPYKLGLGAVSIERLQQYKQSLMQ